ncbi:hypothetical protein HDU93_008441 [Gonapodya sp. JEL0774]|nr:hypothetical protein HDU93_008441 [Gonapodya sp. JEL0774]
MVPEEGGEFPAAVQQAGRTVFGGNSLARPVKTAKALWELTGYMLPSSSPPSSSPRRHTALTASTSILVELLRRHSCDIEAAEGALSIRPASGYVAGPPIPAALLGTPGYIGGGLTGGLPGIDQDKIERLAGEVGSVVAVVEGRVQGIATVVREGWPDGDFGDAVESKVLAGPLGVEAPIPPVPLPPHPAGELPKLIASKPLGAPKLRCCELVAEVLHLSYLLTSSPLWDALGTWRLLPASDFLVIPGSEAAVEGRTVGDALVGVLEGIGREGVVADCVRLLFSHPWNNLLHSVVYDMVAKIFNAYTFLSSLPSQTTASPDSPTSVTQGPVRFRLEELKRAVRGLVVQVLKGGRVVERIVEATRWNEWVVAQPRGARLGYMGHLTHVADEVVKLWDRCAADLEEECGSPFKSDAWLSFTSLTLSETHQRDRTPLGGARPSAPAMGLHLDDAEALEEADVGTHHGVPGTKEGGEEEDGGSGFGEGSGADQFARYLVHRMVADLPTDAIMSSMTAAGTEQNSTDWDSDSNSDEQDPLPPQIENSDSEGESDEQAMGTAKVPPLDPQPLAGAEMGGKKVWKSRDWLANELEEVDAAAVAGAGGLGMEDGFKLVSADNLSTGTASVRSASFLDEDPEDSSSGTVGRRRTSPLRNVQAAVDEEEGDEAGDDEDDLDSAPPPTNQEKSLAVPAFDSDSGFQSLASSGLGPTILTSEKPASFASSFTSGDAWVADFSSAFPGATPLDVSTGRTPITSPSGSPTHDDGATFGYGSGVAAQDNWADFSQFRTGTEMKEGQDDITKNGESSSS